MRAFLAGVDAFACAVLLGQRIAAHCGLRLLLDLLFVVDAAGEEALHPAALGKAVLERFDARAFKFADLISQATFAAKLKMIKAK